MHTRAGYLDGDGEGLGRGDGEGAGLGHVDLRQRLEPGNRFLHGLGRPAGGNSEDGVGPAAGRCSREGGVVTGDVAAVEDLEELRKVFCLCCHNKRRLYAVLGGGVRVVGVVVVEVLVRVDNGGVGRVYRGNVVGCQRRGGAFPYKV